MTLIVVTLTTGTVLLMWLGEQITKRGIGNGISILIFASILTSLPLGISAWWNGGPMERIFFPLIALADRRRRSSSSRKASAGSRSSTPSGWSGAG